MIEYSGNQDLKLSLGTWLERELHELEAYDTVNGYLIDVRRLGKHMFEINARPTPDSTKKHRRFTITIREHKVWEALTYES